MSIALVQQATPVTSCGLSNTISFGSATTVGNLLVLVLCNKGAFIGSATISGGGTYTRADYEGSTGGAYAVYYTLSTSSVSSISFDNSAAGAGIAVAEAYEFSGVDSFDTSSWMSATGGDCSVSITTSVDGDMLLGLHVGGGSDPTGYTALNFNSGSGYGGSANIGTSWKASAGTAGSYTFDFSTGTMSAGVMAFKPAVTSVDGTTPTVTGVTFASGFNAPDVTVDVDASPSGVSFASGFNNPTTSIAWQVFPAGQAVTLNLNNPTVVGDNRAPPAGLALVAAVATPTVTADTSASPAGLSAVFVLGSTHVALDGTAHATQRAITSAFSNTAWAYVGNYGVLVNFPGATDVEVSSLVYSLTGFPGAAGLPTLYATTGQVWTTGSRADDYVTTPAASTTTEYLSFFTTGFDTAQTSITTYAASGAIATNYLANSNKVVHGTVDVAGTLDGRNFYFYYQGTANCADIVASRATFSHALGTSFTVQDSISASGTGAAFSISPTLYHGAQNFIVIQITYLASSVVTTPSVIDCVGNTWIQAATRFSGGIGTAIYYVYPTMAFPGSRHMVAAVGSASAAYNSATPSGVGMLAYVNANWYVEVDETVNATGLGMTSAVHAPTTVANGFVNATGLSMTSALGVVLAETEYDASANATGLAISSALGTVVTHGMGAVAPAGVVMTSGVALPNVAISDDAIASGVAMVSGVTSGVTITTLDYAVASGLTLLAAVNHPFVSTSSSNNNAASSLAIIANYGAPTVEVDVQVTDDLGTRATFGIGFAAANVVMAGYPTGQALTIALGSVTAIAPFDGTATATGLALTLAQGINFATSVAYEIDIDFGGTSVYPEFYEMQVSGTGCSWVLFDSDPQGASAAGASGFGNAIQATASPNIQAPIFNQGSVYPVIVTGAFTVAPTSLTTLGGTVTASHDSTNKFFSGDAFSGTSFGWQGTAASAFSYASAASFIAYNPTGASVLFHINTPATTLTAVTAGTLGTSAARLSTYSLPAGQDMLVLTIAYAAGSEPSTRVVVDNLGNPWRELTHGFANGVGTSIWYVVATTNASVNATGLSLTAAVHNPTGAIFGNARPNSLSMTSAYGAETATGTASSTTNGDSFASGINNPLGVQAGANRSLTGVATFAATTGTPTVNAGATTATTGVHFLTGVGTATASLATTANPAGLNLLMGVASASTEVDVQPAPSGVGLTSLFHNPTTQSTSLQPVVGVTMTSAVGADSTLANGRASATGLHIVAGVNAPYAGIYVVGTTGLAMTMTLGAVQTEVTSAPAQPAGFNLSMGLGTVSATGTASSPVSGLNIVVAENRPDTLGIGLNNLLGVSATFNLGAVSGSSSTGTPNGVTVHTAVGTPLGSGTSTWLVCEAITFTEAMEVSAISTTNSMSVDSITFTQGDAVQFTNH